jgi:hypothetical protein
MQLVWLKFDVDLLSFRHDSDGNGRGVDSSLSFGCWDALHPVDTAFIFHTTEDFFTAHFEYDLLEAADL